MTDDKAACEQAIHGLHPSNSKDRYFNNLSDLFTRLSTEKVDLVVLCNVLHEIRPTDWVKVLGHSGIAGLLVDDGFLNVVEDTSLPHGEKAFHEGFLLLDEAGIENLLGTRSKGRFSTEWHREGKYAKRLVLHQIPRDLLTGVSMDSVRAAVEYTYHDALRRIDELRKNPPTYSAGQMHARYTHQFANAALLLREWGTLKP
jgi:hypothetical protein